MYFLVNCEYYLLIVSFVSNKQVSVFLWLTFWTFNSNQSALAGYTAGALVFISLGYWETFLDEGAQIGIFSKLAIMRKTHKVGRIKLYTFVNLLKIAVMFSMMATFGSQAITKEKLFDSPNIFQRHNITIATVDPEVTTVAATVTGGISTETTLTFPTTSANISDNITFEYTTNAATTTSGRVAKIMLDELIMLATPTLSSMCQTSPLDAVVAFVIQFIFAWTAYLLIEMACKIQTQRSGFALPIAISTPATVLLLIFACDARESGNFCFFSKMMPDYLFWHCGSEKWFRSESAFVSQYLWVWPFWMMSQWWATSHVFFPTIERLAKKTKYVYYI